MSKEQITKAIEAFKKAWVLLGFKGWIADILTALNENKVSKEELEDYKPTLSEADRKAIVQDVRDAMPTFIFADVFQEDVKVVDGKEEVYVRFSDKVLERFAKLEKFDNDLKQF